MAVDIAAYTEALESTQPLVRLRELIATQMETHSRDEVLAVLNELRQEFRDVGDARHEDAVLDVMDVVVGWCSPHMKIQ